jgi:hypothetical protein
LDSGLDAISGLFLSGARIHVVVDGPRGYFGSRITFPFATL